MEPILRRSVYQHILDQPDRRVEVTGSKVFVHTKIARGMGQFDREREIRDIITWLIREGYVLASRNKRMIWIDNPIDPAIIDEVDSPTVPQPGGPVVLPGRAYVPHANRMPSLPVTGVLTEVQAAGESPDQAVVAESSANGRSPTPSPPRTTTVQPAVRRPTRPKRADPPPPSARMRAENRRLVADNERLKRELAAATRLANEAEARLQASRVPPSTRIIWYLAQLIVAMNYQFAAERAQLQEQLEEARRDLREAEGSIRTLERRPTADRSAEVRRLETRIRDLDSQVNRLKTAKTKLEKDAADLRRKVAQLEKDADQDGEELSNMIESLESAERLLNRFRGNRIMEQRPLIGCGHMVIMMVDPAHNPRGALSSCHELELTEIVR